jgi:Uma2 family endonuclease
VQGRGASRALFSWAEYGYIGGEEAAMNVHLPVHLDKTGFLAWAQGREERYELAQGRVVMMVGASRAHGILVRNLLVILHGQLNPLEWSVISDFGLDLGPETLRYPDIMVERAGGAAKDRMTSQPVLVTEVLSPSTTDIDLGDKAAEYLQLASLSCYLVLSQDTPKAWIWQRGPDGFPPGPHVIVGHQILRIAALNVPLPLGAVYAGVQTE